MLTVKPMAYQGVNPLLATKTKVEKPKDLSFGSLESPVKYLIKHCAYCGTEMIQDLNASIDSLLYGSQEDFINTLTEVKKRLKTAKINEAEIVVIDKLLAFATRKENEPRQGFSILQSFSDKMPFQPKDLPFLTLDKKELTAQLKKALTDLKPPYSDRARYLIQQKDSMTTYQYLTKLEELAVKYEQSGHAHTKKTQPIRDTVDRLQSEIVNAFIENIDRINPHQFDEACAIVDNADTSKLKVTLSQLNRLYEDYAMREETPTQGVREIVYQTHDLFVDRNTQNILKHDKPKELAYMLLNPLAVSLEHVQPQSLDGEDDTANYLDVCRSCNCYRSSKDFEEMLEIPTLVDNLKAYMKEFKTVLDGLKNPQACLKNYLKNICSALKKESEGQLDLDYKEIVA